MAFDNVSRKNKIRCALAFVAVGILACALWREDDQGQVSVTFTGVSANDSNRVLFAITNSFKNLVYYRVLTHEPQEGGVFGPALWFMREDRELAGRSAVDFEVVVSSTNRWSMGVTYFDSASISGVFKLRARLALYAYEHHWERLSTWLYPRQNIGNAAGPEMLGNRPAPAAP